MRRGRGHGREVERLKWHKVAAAAIGLGAALALPAQNFTTLANFADSNGSGPLFMSLVQAGDGNFYGTTVTGGAYGWGSVFQITPQGTLTTMHSFDVSDGEYPYAGLALGTDGNLYGTTLVGGSYFGTVFKTTLAGMFTNLHMLTSSGAYPYGGLVQGGAGGNFYGTTFYGGSSTLCPYGCGTVFRVSSSGAVTTLSSFTSTNGSGPASGLILGIDGNFYGTTFHGGTSTACDYGCGTIYKVTSSGTLTSLVSLASINGANPHGGLIQASDGNFYGTTTAGGTNSCLPPGCGTVFKVTSSGALTTLYSFCSQANCADGMNPSSSLIQATDGNLYGTTANGGAYYGTVFKITTAGTLTTLHSFDSSDGAYPYGGLVQGTDGNLYGTTYYGGSGYGTVFKLSVGLGPFVKALPTGGMAGVAVSILGTNLTGASSVTFNGTAAVYNVVSSSLITTTVPSGATTGPIRVITPGGTLVSNLPFRVP